MIRDNEKEYELRQIINAELTSLSNDDLFRYVVNAEWDNDESFDIDDDSQEAHLYFYKVGMASHVLRERLFGIGFLIERTEHEIKMSELDKTHENT